MAKDCSCVKQIISLGPWGYNDTGNEWSYRTKQGGIKQIIIRCGGIIDSLMFKGKNSDGDDDHSTKFGGDGGDRTFKIDIDFPSEYLTGISGTYGSFWMFGHNVCSLTFHTNKKKYGPFGSGNGTAFSVNLNGGVITGFHGRCGRYLESIGLYIMPEYFLATEVKEKEQPGQRSAGPRGGDGGRDWDDGVFAAVHSIQVFVEPVMDVVSAVQFCYVKSDGSYFTSPYYGQYLWGFKSKSTTIHIGEGEYVIGMEGFYGPVNGVDVITSLTFITNKGKRRPFGAQIGTFFTLMNSGDCNRKVVGFHGRSDAYLHAIGLHTQYL